MTTQAMLRTHPRPLGQEVSVLARCIEACFECAQTCTACADACLAEEGVAELRRCIRLNLDCADICAATGEALSRLTDPNIVLLQRLVEVCALACRECGAECESHVHHHEHCRVCAEACRRCEAACSELVGELGQRR